MKMTLKMRKRARNAGSFRDSAHFSAIETPPTFTSRRCARCAYGNQRFLVFKVLFMMKSLHKTCSARQGASNGIHNACDFSQMYFSVPLFSACTTCLDPKFLICFYFVRTSFLSRTFLGGFQIVTFEKIFQDGRKKTRKTLFLWFSDIFRSKF